MPISLNSINFGQIGFFISPNLDQSSLLCIKVGQLIVFSSLSTVSMECDYFTFRVIAKRALFYPDDLIGPDELLLGASCPVTSIRPDELEFYYDIHSCGTFIQVREGTVFLGIICKVFSSVVFCPCLNIYKTLVLPS